MSSAEAPKHEDPAAKPAAKKVDKKAERLAAKLREEEEARKKKEEEMKQYAHMFGPQPLIESKTFNTKKFVEIKDINDTLVNQKVLLRARIHTARKKSSKMGFLQLRQLHHTVQALVLADETIPALMVAYACGIPCESVVDVAAVVVKAGQPITGCSCQDYELQIKAIHCVSASAPVLPFQYEDASRSAEAAEGKATVNVDTRLLCRWLDMRTLASNSIFRIQSRVGQYFRQFCIDNNFTEIHTPKLIATASEGGANVFKLDYFGKKAFLAQSPQLYKQMALQGDLERVFEVAPVFRAENSNTHRHLTEFVGLDLEMRINEHYFEVLDMAEELFGFMFTKLGGPECATELSAINAQHPFEPFKHQILEEKVKELQLGIVEEGVESKDEFGGFIRNMGTRMLRMPYPKAIALLNTVIEKPLEETDDINTENEKRLGVLVKQRYGVDFYISDRFPQVARPFYTMPCPDDKRFSNSYDMFIRGEEISSGAQRIHDPELLEQRAKELGIDAAPLKDYIDSFRLGAWPHGGFGVGLERVVMLYLGLKNVRYASLFPRDPIRVTP